MTDRERLIVMAYTGVAMTRFDKFHKFTEEILGRPVFTHEFASQDVIDERIGFGESVNEKLKEKVKPLFLELCDSGVPKP